MDCCKLRSYSEAKWAPNEQILCPKTLKNMASLWGSGHNMTTPPPKYPSRVRGNCILEFSVVSSGSMGHGQCTRGQQKAGQQNSQEHTNIRVLHLMSAMLLTAMVSELYPALGNTGYQSTCTLVRKTDCLKAEALEANLLCMCVEAPRI